jgi:hypothetical protein
VDFIQKSNSSRRDQKSSPGSWLLMCQPASTCTDKTTSVLSPTRKAGFDDDNVALTGPSAADQPGTALRTRASEMAARRREGIIEISRTNWFKPNRAGRDLRAAAARINAAEE